MYTGLNDSGELDFSVHKISAFHNLNDKRISLEAKFQALFDILSNIEAFFA